MWFPKRDDSMAAALIRHLPLSRVSSTDTIERFFEWIFLYRNCISAGILRSTKHFVGMQKSGLIILICPEKRHFLNFGTIQFFMQSENETFSNFVFFFQRRCSDWDFCWRSEACIKRELRIRGPRQFSIDNTLLFFRLSRFWVKYQGDKYLKKSFSRSIELFWGTFFKEIKRPLTEKYGSENRDESIFLTSLRILELSGFWCRKQAKTFFSYKIFHT